VSEFGRIAGNHQRGPSGGVKLMKVSDKELERRMVFARQEAARAWQQPLTSVMVLDPYLAEEFAKILVVHMYEPHLGCARTSELEAEVKARGDRETPTIEEN
jgi:hypothetical protein